MDTHQFHYASPEGPRIRHGSDAAMPAATQASRLEQVIHFAGANVDFTNGRICSPEGHEEVLRRQTAAVLRALASSPGEICSKAELFDAVWGDVAVTEDSLVQCVHEIRRALGSARELVQTLPRQGYRLSLACRDEDTQAKGGRWSLAVIGNSETAEGAIPCESEIFSDDLANALSQYPGVTVIACPPSPNPGRSTDLRNLAHDLGVGHLVICRFAALREQLRLLVQLVEGCSARILWSDRMVIAASDRESQLVDVATALANRICGYGGVLDRQRLLRARGQPSSRLGARDLYALADEGFEKQDRETALHAYSLAERCTVTYPDFARGWLMLAWQRYRLQLFGWGDLGPSWMHEEHKLFGRAVDLDPRDPLALCFFALSSAKIGARSQAIRLVERAVERCKGDPQAVVELSLGLSTVSGEPMRALEMIDGARDREANPPAWWGDMEGRAAFFAGQYERALVASDIAPQTPQKLVFRALSAAELSDCREAVAIWRELFTLIPGFSFRRYATVLPITHPASLATYEASVAKLNKLVTRAGSEVKNIYGIQN